MHFGIVEDDYDMAASGRHLRAELSVYSILAEWVRKHYYESYTLPGMEQ